MTRLMAVVFLALLLAALFIGGIVWFVIRANRSAKAQMAAGAAMQAQLTALIGPGAAGNPHQPAEVRFGDRQYHIRLVPGGRNAPPSLQVELPIEVRFAGGKTEHGAYREPGRRRVGGKLAVLLRKESVLDRFGKRIGLNVEHQTGDAEFDRELYIESDASGADWEMLLSDPTTRQAIQQLLAMGFASVELFRTVAAVRTSFVAPTAEALSRVPEAAARLAQIADNLPSFNRDPVGRAFALRTMIAASAGLVSAIASCVLVGVTANRYPPPGGPTAGPSRSTSRRSSTRSAARAICSAS